MASETKIYLIRHGSVDNPDDISYGRMPLLLSEEGVSQMHQLCNFLKSRDIVFDVIFSSPVERAIQSAEIVREENGVPGVEIREEITDVGVGELEGKPMQILRDVNYSYEKLEEIGYSLESKEAMIERSGRLVDEVKKEYEGKSVAFVSHGDVIRLILWALENPEKRPPGNLRDANYLAVAEAAVLTFRDNEYIGFEIIGREGRAPEKDQIRRTEAY